MKGDHPTDPASSVVRPPSSVVRHIWLCADDYGIAPGVNAAIRDLIMRGRLNATSVMVVAPRCTRAEVRSLAILNSGAPRAAIGLHLTFTAPFRPLTPGFRPLGEDGFPLLRDLFKAGGVGLGFDGGGSGCAASSVWRRHRRRHAIVSGGAPVKPKWHHETLTLRSPRGRGRNHPLPLGERRVRVSIRL